jgi:uncharacterized protein (TIGR02147 family)
VLNQHAHFSLEQAEEINALLGLSLEEGAHFLRLVQLARAGTPRLRTRLEAQLREAIEKRLLLRERVEIKKRLSPAEQIQYYSTWQYAAIHIALTIPRLQTPDAIARHFHLPREKVAAALEFLVSIGIAKREGERYLPGIDRIFLGSDSAMVAKHHTNWRMRAIEAFDRTEDQNLHLSTVVSISRADIDRIKEKLLSEIQKTRALIRESAPEEELYVYNVDFFRL